MAALLIVCAAWLAWAPLAHALIDNPRNDPASGLLWLVMKAYCRIVHRVRVGGREYIPSAAHPGPLVLVANHTASVDPLLIQAVVPFHVRFMMSDDMIHPALAGVFEWAGIVPVSANGRESTSARAALRVLGEERGVLGIFPEGGIERPRERLMAFRPGVGLLVARSGAPVLPVVIRDTPRTLHAWRSLFMPSRARLDFMPVISYEGEKASAIAPDLQRRFAQWTGWPVAGG
ncbi:MAG: 1-acyl-sn-glycerol-3-phosphate acyltransferase [Phycisphaerae bacterium]|nr:1-acyl-sn-glycerol-3-phosphate acyltransferase [Phycisphaerae bacterium]